MSEQPPTTAPAAEKSTPELLRDLSDQMTTLVRQELQLARAEMTTKGKQAGLGIGMFGAAGVFAAWMLGALTAAAILALSLVFASWVAALVVTGILAIIAGALALVGRTRLSRGVPPTPQQTTETIKEDMAMAKQRVKDGRS